MISLLFLLLPSRLTLRPSRRRKSTPAETAGRNSAPRTASSARPRHPATAPSDGTKRDNYFLLHVIKLVGALGIHVVFRQVLFLPYNSTIKGEKRVSSVAITSSFASRLNTSCFYGFIFCRTSPTATLEFPFGSARWSNGRRRQKIIVLSNPMLSLVALISNLPLIAQSQQRCGLLIATSYAFNATPNCSHLLANQNQTYP